MDAHVCMSMWRPQDTLRCHLQERCPPPLRQGLELELTNLTRLAYVRKDISISRQAGRYTRIPMLKLGSSRSPGKLYTD